MTARRVAALTLAFCAAVVITGCGATRSGPVAAPAPPRVPGEATSGPDLAGVQLPNFTMPLITGGVSRPKRSLTPGAVASTNTAAVCAGPHRASGSSIPWLTQVAVYQEYGLGNPHLQSKYQINYLVPLVLGGARTMANMWPAALKGTGFFQKAQLDHVLRDLVCRRTVTLATAQRDLERNWYVAWLRYVVSTGRA